MKELTKEEAKRPDLMTQELKAGFTWTVQHSKAVIAAIAIFLVVGGGVAIYNYLSEKKETSLQEKFYALEKSYGDLRTQFEKAKNPQASKNDGKESNQALPALVASGDIEKDYGSVVVGLKALVDEAPKSKAAGMAALMLVEIYQEYQKPSEAKEILSKVQGVGGLMGALIRSELGTQMANQSDCKSASEVWSGLLKEKQAEFLGSSLRLKLGLCAQASGNVDQAETYYKELTEKYKETSSAKVAEKLLRTLQVKSAL